MYQRLVACCLAVFSLACSSGQPYADSSDAVQQSYLARLDELARRVEQLDSAAANLHSSANVASAAAAFDSARQAFKQVEHLIAYWSPTAHDQINGPAIPEQDPDAPDVVLPPDGFQVLEELLFAESPWEVRDDIVEQTRIVRALLRRVTMQAETIRMTDVAAFDAVHLDLGRLASLGLSGFDSPVAQRWIGESAESLRGIKTTLALFAATRRASTEWAQTVQWLNAAVAYLHDHPEPLQFNHLEFLVEYLIPSSRSIDTLRQALNVGLPGERRGWLAQSATLFDSGAFDPLGFSPRSVERITSQSAALGARLFIDGRLSPDGRTCSSCHEPARAFVDGRTRSIARTGGKSGAVLRNSPTLINAGLQVGSFSDLRTTYLEDQIDDVVRNPHEMGGDLAHIADILSADASTRESFATVFGDAADSTVNSWRIRRAIADYIRSLQALNAPFDRYVRGDRSALDSSAQHGFNVFMGKGRCGSCHFLPLTNGTMPPEYRKAELEVLGVPSEADTVWAIIDPDVGAYGVSRLFVQKHAFKTPTLRNIELTAPYMHNGVYETLEQVIDFYNRGGGAGIGITLPNQTLPPDPLNLTPAEQSALIAFLRALTDTITTSKP